MPDQFTTTATTGYGSRLVKSLSGVVFGFILFIASFGLLYWNEGRVDLSNIAKTAKVISAEIANKDQSLDGKLVSATGIVNSNLSYGDNLFLNPDKYFAIQRKVEMFAWKETQNSTTHDNVGGSSTTTTTYSYSKDWEQMPADSSSFKYPSDHQNPQKTLDDFIGYTSPVTVGVYNFEPSTINLPSFTQVQLTPQNTTLSQGAILANDSYLFISNTKGSAFANPSVGDLRISYSVLRPGFEGTIFGALNGSSIDPYTDAKGNSLYRLFAGPRSQAIATYHSEYVLWTWILRGIGFLMMWIGLALLFSPIIILLDILPIFGEITGALVGIATFFVALILALVTIFVSMLLHRIVALIVALVIVVAAIISFFIFLREKKKAKSQTAAPPPVQ